MAYIKAWMVLVRVKMGWVLINEEWYRVLIGYECASSRILCVKFRACLGACVHVCGGKGC